MSNKGLHVYPGVTPEQLEALKDEAMDFMVLGSQDIKNNNLEIDEEGNVLVNEGTLLHGTTFNKKKDDEKIESIAVNGIITREFFGSKEKGGTYYHAEFYRANRNMTLKEFLSDERAYFPKKDNGIIAFLVINSDVVSELFKNNSLEEGSNVTDEIRSLVEEGLVYHKDELENKTVAAIPIGVPTNCLSAVIVSDDIKEDKEKMERLHELFPKLYILDLKGKALVLPLNEETNE